MSFDTEIDGLEKLLYDKAQDAELNGGVDRSIYSVLLEDLKVLRSKADYKHPDGVFGVYTDNPIASLIKEHFINIKDRSTITKLITLKNSYKLAGKYRNIINTIIEYPQQSFADMYEKHKQLRGSLQLIKDTSATTTTAQALYETAITTENNKALAQMFEKVATDKLTNEEIVVELSKFKDTLPTATLDEDEDWSPGCAVLSINLLKKEQEMPKKFFNNEVFDTILSPLPGACIVGALYNTGKSHHTRAMGHNIILSMSTNVMYAINEASIPLTAYPEFMRLTTNIPLAVYNENILQKYSASGREANFHRTYDNVQLDEWLIAQADAVSNYYENKAEIMALMERTMSLADVDTLFQESTLAGAQNQPRPIFRHFSSEKGTNTVNAMLDWFAEGIDKYNCHTFFMDQISNVDEVRMAEAQTGANVIKDVLLRINEFGMNTKTHVVPVIQLQEKSGDKGKFTVMGSTKGPAGVESAIHIIPCPEYPSEKQDIVIDKARSGGLRGATLTIDRSSRVPLPNYAGGKMSGIGNWEEENLVKAEEKGEADEFWEEPKKKSFMEIEG